MPNDNFSTDDDLVIASLGCDERAAALLYNRYAGQIFRIVYRIVLNESLANDAAQETWIKVFRYLNRYRLGSSFVAWTSSIAVRTAIDQLRKNAHSLNTEPLKETISYAALNDSSVHTQLAGQEIEDEVKNILQRLPENQRIAFILRHFEGMPLREIGETLNCTEGTVKAHIYRAVNVVRKHLSKWIDVEVKRS